MVDEGGLWGGVNPTRISNCLIEIDWNIIQLKTFTKVCLCVIVLVVHYNNGKIDFATIISNQRPEMWHIELRTRARRVEKVKEHWPVLLFWNVDSERNQVASFNRSVIVWNRSREIVFKILVPEDVSDDTKNGRQPNKQHYFSHCLRLNRW